MSSEDKSAHYWLCTGVSIGLRSEDTGRVVSLSTTVLETIFLALLEHIRRDKI